jgi:glycosyltransferase involved in cell wall biosynthesis
MQTTPLIRPFWLEEHEEYHKKYWERNDITVLICQRKTLDLIQLCLSSLLRFYPDIPILVVDGDSRDISTVWLRHMAIKHKNIQIWEKPLLNGAKHSSHGVTMDEAIWEHVHTKHVLIMDSDTIVERGGWIEEMLSDLYVKSNSGFAIGSLMSVSDSGDACRPPIDENDILLYSHPSCSLMRVDIYKNFNAKFCDHGAPSVYVMKEARKRGFDVLYFPIERYVSHLSGSSWTEPRTVWNNDHDVMIRPFFTMIKYMGLTNISFEPTDNMDIIFYGNETTQNTVVHDDGVPNNYSNRTYNQRFNVRGEYVFEDAGEPLNCYTWMKIIVDAGEPDSMIIGRTEFIKRSIWQRKNALR